MKLRLNLATSPLENNRRYILTVSLAGLIAIASLVTLGATAFGHWRANRDLREEISRLESDLRDYRAQRHDLEEFFKQPATRQLMDHAEFLNGLIEQRSFPWTRIFSSLERRLPEGVRVESVSPRMQEGRVELRLVFGAADDAAKLRFLKTLENSPEFSRLEVVAESRPRTGDGSDQLQVEISAHYVPTERLQQISSAAEKEEEEGTPAPRKASSPAPPPKAAGSPAPTTARRLP
jgi:Tfp pilus assembly protein PilN